MAKEKDWKAEYDKLRGQYDQVLQERNYLREKNQYREQRDEGIRDKFKELLIDVLGR